MCKWRARNRKRLKLWGKRYYARTKTKQKRKAIQWQKDNPERFRLITKAVSANAKYPGHLTVNQVEEIIQRCGRVCHWCGRENLSGRVLTLEHLKPINDSRFIVVACLQCNAAKLHKNGREHRLTAKEKSELVVQRVRAWVVKNKDRVRNYQRIYMSAYRKKKRAV
jgi:hypothetical protein